jgi:hypothetical protein
VPVAPESGTSVGGLAHMTGIEGMFDGEAVHADVRRLDGLEIDGEVTLIKVDVEGAELFVLRGAREMLMRHEPVVVCEIGRGITDVRYGIDSSEIERMMTGLGYETFKYVGDRLERARLGPRHDGNYVFVPPRRLATAQGLVVR